MQRQKELVNNYLKAVKCSRLTIDRANAIIRDIVANDPYGLSEFEVSFKVTGSVVGNECRVLSFDNNLYASLNPYIFLERLKIFQGLIKKRLPAKRLKEAMRALGAAAGEHPDLYFGFDARGSEYLFAFWLILGGVKPDGSVKIKPAARKILGDALDILGLKLKLPKMDILNIGLDISKDELFFKVYYLLGKSLLIEPYFKSLIACAALILKDYEYCTFFSERFDLSGKMIFKKLYFEFLQNVSFDDKNLPEFITSLSALGGLTADRDKVLKIIKDIGGRISIIAFGSDNSVTFYIRTC